MTGLPRLRRPVRGSLPGSSRRLVLAVSLLLLAPAFPGTAAAAPEAGALVVEGRGNSATQWVLPRDLQLGDVMPQLAGGGDYAGVLIESLDDPSARLGAVQVRAFRDGTAGAVGLVGGRPVLESGRYRVTLLGEGPVRVRYRLSSSTAEGVRVVPRTRLGVRFLGRAEALPRGVSGAAVELPGAAAAGRRVLQVALLSAVSVQDVRMCATTGSACDGRPSPACPPASLPCGHPSAPQPAAGTGEARALVRLHAAERSPRSLVWSASGYRDADDRLRAAALVF